MDSPTLTNATVALAVATFILAGISATQAYLSRKALQQQLDVTDRDFRFEIVRQTLAAAPMLVVEPMPDEHRRLAGGAMLSTPGHLEIVNRGLGPALKIRFSCLHNGKTLAASNRVVPPLGQNGRYGIGITIDADGNNPFHVDEFVVRYEDVLGNLYASEYRLISKAGGWLSWKRPWIGQEFGLLRPLECSEDDAPWGSTSRESFFVDGNQIR